jgi:hypothetical protein
MATRIDEFGGQGGSDFALEFPQSIGFRHGDLVDALSLNGNLHGGQGGDNPIIISLDTDDYWTTVEVHSGGSVDYLRFKSDRNVEISGGGGGGDTHLITGVRLLRVGGRSGGSLDNIRLEYVENYKASTVIVDDAYAVLDFKPGGVKITSYREQTIQIAEAYSLITEHTSEFTMNASAEGEYYAKFSISTGLKTVDTSREEIKNSSDQAMKTSETIEDTLDSNQIGVLVGAIRIMQDSDQNYWVYPSKNPNWTKLGPSQINGLVGYYDFTSGLGAQTGLKHESQYGLQKLTSS